MRLSTLIPLLLLHLSASIWSAEPPGYYAAAQGLSGPALRTALHNIIRHTQSLPYSAPAGTFDTSDALMVLDHSIVRFVSQKNHAVIHQDPLSRSLPTQHEAAGLRRLDDSRVAATLVALNAHLGIQP